MKKLVLLILCLTNFSGNFSYILIFNPMQKCGTFLTLKLIKLLTGWERHELAPNKIKKESDLPPLKPNQYYHLHHYPGYDYLLEIFSQPKYKGIFVHRDPRDGFNSLLHFIPKVPRTFGKLATLSYGELFDIKVEEYFTLMKSLLPWKGLPNFFTLRFEDIVGSKGGGSDIVQRITIVRLAKHLEIELTSETLNYIIDNLFGGTWTFRKGQIGSWKADMSDEQKAKMHPYAVETVLAYGYEY